MKSIVLAIALANPILFVTQVPVPADFTTVASTFGNQVSSVAEAPRGGDLWIRYPDGTLKNLTRAAGFGNDGMQQIHASRLSSFEDRVAAIYGHQYTATGTSDCCSTARTG